MIDRIRNLFHSREEKPVVRIEAIEVEDTLTQDEEITCPCCQVPLEHERFPFRGENPWQIVEVKQYTVWRCPECHLEFDGGEYEQLTQKVKEALEEISID